MFVRELWFQMLQPLGIDGWLLPDAEEADLVSWWLRQRRSVAGEAAARCFRLPRASADMDSVGV